MLPPAYRMRRSTQFSSVVRSGVRARRGVLVVYQGRLAGEGPAMVGLTVGRTVGNSVLRHAVSRRLRAQLAQRLELLPAGSGTVVRALPGSAQATSRQLGRDLDAALQRLRDRLSGQA